MKNAIIEKLTATVKNWKAQFDNPPNINLTFTVSDAEKLRLNGIELCDVSDVDLEQISHDVEHLTVGPVRLHIEWPYAGKFRLTACREIPLDDNSKL